MHSPHLYDELIEGGDDRTNLKSKALDICIMKSLAKMTLKAGKEQNDRSDNN